MHGSEERPRTPVVWILALTWIVLHGIALVLTGSLGHPSGSLLQWGAPGMDVLIRMGADLPSLVRLGEWQRLITYAFLHGFVLHLLFNTWVWFTIGRMLEAAIGSSRLWIIFVVASVGGALTHQFLYPEIYDVSVEGIPPMVGASGGVFGAVGALGVWAFFSRHPAAPAARGTVILFLVLSALLFFLPGIAHLGHLGGLAGGALAMALLGPRRSGPKAGAGAKLIAFVLLAVVLSAAFARASAPDLSGQDRLLDDLRAMEKLGYRLYDDPLRAKPEERRELGRRLDALGAGAGLPDEQAAAALRAYLEAWRPVADGNVPHPWAFEAALDRAKNAWTPHLRRLEAGSGRHR